jgi:hypothetical protein
MLRRCFVFVGLVVVGAAQPAAASFNYPADLAEHLSAPKVPACTLCHQSASGGDALVTPFVEAMRAEGLQGGGQTALLTTALDALDAAGTDSDGDGTSDVDELRAGEDPNAAGESNAGPSPEYGFGCAAAAPAAAPLLGVVAALGLLALRRRR